MKNPPVLVSIIGFFALIAGLAWIFLGLRILGFDWFGVLGDLPKFDQVGLWGWLALLAGVLWCAAALGLWSLQPWAWLFAILMAGLALFEAFLWFIEYPGTGIGLGMAIMPLVILFYLNTREVKVAFGLADDSDAMAGGAAPRAFADAPTAQATMPAAPAAPAMPAAPVAAAAVVGAAAARSDSDVTQAAAAPVAPVVEAGDTSAAPMAAAPMAAAPDTMPPSEASDAASSDAPVPGVPHVQVEDVEGIGPAYGAKLSAAGIRTTSDLLTAGAKPGGRDRIAEATGISHKLILEWVNNVDLMRIPGVGPQYSDLLEAAGVDSPAELAHRNASNLAVTVQEVVAARPGIVRRVPTEAEIAGWIEEARRLDKVVEH